MKKLNSGNSAFDTVIADAKYLPYLYHGTGSEHVESIKKHGLRPSPSHYGMEEFEGTPMHNVAHNFVTPDPGEAAAEYATSMERTDKKKQEREVQLEKERAAAGNPSRPAVVRLHREHPSLKNLKKDRFSRGGYMTQAHIPPEAIHSIEVINKNPYKWADAEHARLNKHLSEKNKKLHPGKPDVPHSVMKSSYGTKFYSGKKFDESSIGQEE